jgi:7,8-dihydropterin-6-yl-methyl-4-(beta-D-ribofuranosyl)aminobenzene 5'-phosphate synthase
MNKIICVVDNSALKGTHLKTEHGLAFWIETEYGKALFDTGQTADVLSHNMSLLNLNAKDIDALAISHAHYDHTGGLEAVLPENPNLAMYANADVFRQKFSLHDGKYDASGFEKSQEEIVRRVEVHLSDAPMEIFPNLWTSGEITKRVEPEGRSNSHYIRVGGKWQPDPYRDDMSLVLKTQDGLVLICGCCHAGLLNTLFHVERNFEGPIIAVLGGTHLMTADGKLLDHVINVLDERYSDILFYLNHCTGDTAIKTLANAFGERVNTFLAGAVVTFEDQLR